MHQPPWMCNNQNCAFRNRLLADAKLTTPHVCQPWRIPVFVNPFPPPRPITFLPPPPLAPAPPLPFYFPPPSCPQPAPPALFPMPGPPVPMMPPAPMPPGPYMFPPPPSAPPQVQPAPLPPPQPEQKALPPASPEPKKSPSIGSFVHEERVHKFEPRKRPISKRDKEALSDFEERTRRQEYRDLTESSQHASSHKSEASKPRPILKHRQPATPAVNQEVHVNVYNGGDKSKAGAKNNTTDSSQSAQSVPAKDAASVREEAIKRAHSLAQGIAKATAPAAMMSGALPPLPDAGSHAPSKAPSHPSTKAPSHSSTKAPSHPSTKAPSHQSAKHHPHVSRTDNAAPAPSNAPSSIKTPTHRSGSPRAGPHHHPSPALADAMANSQVSPPSIESWRESVRRPIVGA